MVAIVFRMVMPQFQAAVLSILASQHANSFMEDFDYLEPSQAAFKGSKCRCDYIG